MSGATQSSSSDMLIQNPAGQNRQRAGQELKELIVPAVGGVRRRGKRLLSEIVLIVVGRTFRGSPTEFVSAKALVLKGRAAKIENPFPGQCPLLDSGPHHKIIRAQLLKFEIGRAEFINGFFAGIQKESRSNRASAVNG